MKRIITAAILAPAVTYIVIWAPFPAFALVLGIIASLCFWEFEGIAEGHGIDIPRLPGIAGGLLVLFGPSDLTVAILVTLIAMIVALGSTDLRNSLPRAGTFALGILYIFGAWHTAVQLRLINSYWLFLALALNWIGDTAAMYVGKAIGRRKLAPRISPGKSWEGSIASVVASVIFSATFAHWAMPETPVWLPLSAGLIGNVAGQLGDLSESAMKRGAGMKDSGTLLPGHGGWLDRVDSSLFSVPAVYALLKVASMAGVR